MDDMTAFESQLAAELGQMAGPGRRVDGMAMVRAVATQSPKWRFQSMFSATKFVVAGVIVALFGGFLLMGLLTTSQTIETEPGVEASLEHGFVSGSISTGDVANPEAPARLVVTLKNAAASADSEPLGSYTHEVDAASGRRSIGSFPFTIEYPIEGIDDGADYQIEAVSIESESGRIFAISEEPVTVVIDGSPIEDVELRFISTPNDGTVPQLSGTLYAFKVGTLDGPVRLLFSVIDASANDGSPPLAESLHEFSDGIELTHTYALDYDPALVDEDGMYLLQARLEDAATGAWIASSEPIPVITDGNPVVGADVRLKDESWGGTES